MQHLAGSGSPSEFDTVSCLTDMSKAARYIQTPDEALETAVSLHPTVRLRKTNHHPNSLIEQRMKKPLTSDTNH